jgi:hypothetical protein
MYSLQVANEDGKLVEIDTHDTCASAVEFMLAVWHEDDQPPAFAAVVGPTGCPAAILTNTRDGMVRVKRAGGSITTHAVTRAPLVTL